MTPARARRRVAISVPAILVALAAAGTLAVLLQTSRYGVEVTNDSVNYFAAARSFAADHSLVRYDGRPFVHWPPLFPVLLSVHAPSMTGTAVTARWLDALAFGAVVLVTGSWLRHLVARSGLVVVGTAIVAFGQPLTRAASSAWSETVFVLLSVLALRTLERARRPDAGVRDVLVPAALAGAAALTRYAGCFLILAGAIALVVRVPPVPLTRRRVLAAAAYVGIATLPVGLWFLRNRQVGGTAAGQRAGSIQQARGLLVHATDTVTGWALPPAVPLLLRTVLVLTLVGVVAGLAWRGRGAGATTGTTPTMLTLGLFLAVYGVGILVASRVTNLDPPGDRILSPLFVPAVVVGVLLLDAAWVGASSRATRAMAAGLAGLFLYQLAAAAYFALPAHQAGRFGFGGPRWTRSEVMAHLPPAAAVAPRATFTNQTAAVYYRTGRSIRDIFLSGFGDGASFDFAAVGGTATVVWFGVDAQDGAPPPFSPTVSVVPVSVTADGGVYLVRPRVGP